MWSDPNWGTIYLFYESKHIGLINALTVGRTKSAFTRVKSYRYDTIEIMACKVRDITVVEKLVKDEFKKAGFKLVVGLETFEGDFQEMYALFDKVTRPYRYVPQFVAIPVDKPVVKFQSSMINYPQDEEVNRIVQAGGCPSPKQVEILMKFALEYLSGEEGVVKCPKCQKPFVTKHRLKQHLQNQVKCCTQTMINRENLTTICARCKVEFADVWICKTHMKKANCTKK